MHRNQRTDPSAGLAIYQLAVATIAVLVHEDLHAFRREIESDRIDIAEDRSCIQPGDDTGRCEKRIRGRDDLVTRTDVERHQRKQQRVGAGRDADAVTGIRVGRDLLLELDDLRPEYEVLGSTEIADCGLDGRFQRRVLRAQVEQRNLHQKTDE